jgi:hypothetical protein
VRTVDRIADPSPADAYVRPVTEAARFPSFFVVGAPRCGTTSLCRYLARNPQVCFSRPKEPHYFVRLDHEPSRAELERDYLDRYFGHHLDTHRAVGEGSVSYLYAPDTLERIRHWNPDARFIALVRDPLSMLPSYHLRMLFLLQEDEQDFARAWELQTARARGERIPRLCLDPRLLLYGEVAKLGAQIERLFAVAGRERSLVVLFDDLVAEPAAVYRRVLEFIGVDDDGRRRFERKYESRTYRSRWLQRLLYRPAIRPGGVVTTLQRRARRRAGDGPGRKKKSLIKRLTRWNTVSVRPAPLAPEMRTIVRETLAPDVERLSNLLGRDLSHWLGGPDG